jgi:ATP-dependent RNA helicase DHX57
LKGVTHVIVDEVHERSLDSDLLLLLLRDVLMNNSELRVILMSATANAELFRDYFNSILPNGKDGMRPSCILEIPGFTYDVRELLLEDVISELHQAGATH